MKIYMHGLWIECDAPTIANDTRILNLIVSERPENRAHKQIEKQGYAVKSSHKARRWTIHHIPDAPNAKWSHETTISTAPDGVAFVSITTRHALHQDVLDEILAAYLDWQRSPSEATQ